MRVVLLAIPSVWGGIESHTVALASSLARRGHSVAIVAINSDVYYKAPSCRNTGCEVIRINTSRPVGRVRFFEWLWKFRCLKADVGIFVKGSITYGNFQLELAARMMFPRYITVEHGSRPTPEKTSQRHFGGLVPGIGLWWYRSLLSKRLRSRMPHQVICNSQSVREQLTSKFHFPPRKVIAIHNGVDLSLFRPDPEARAKVRSSWGVDQDTLVFGSVGRLGTVKGFDTAIRLFRLLVYESQKHKLRLVLVGEGPERQNLQRIAGESGIAQMVAMPGFSERPWEAYPGMDVFLMPSLREGVPLALLEAMASGCCVIANAVGGVPEVLTSPGCGWLVLPGNSERFLQAMRAAMLKSPRQREEMKWRARAHVQAHFDADEQLARIARLIECNGADAHTISP